MTQIAFLGAGRMATAMVRGLLKSKTYTPEDISCTSAKDASAKRLSSETGIRATQDSENLMQSADIIVLAFKPKNLPDFTARFTDKSPPPLIISVLGGTSLEALKQQLRGPHELVRIMPNIPCEEGAGFTPYTSEKPLSEANQARINQFLNALGTSIETSEADLERATRVTGCGPAYFYELTDALAKAGEASGLPAETAQIFAQATLIGSARLLEASGREPIKLRDEVASPGGITEKMLNIMNDSNFRNLIEKIVTTPHN